MGARAAGGRFNLPCRRKQRNVVESTRGRVNLTGRASSSRSRPTRDPALEQGGSPRTYARRKGSRLVFENAERERLRQVKLHALAIVTRSRGQVLADRQLVVAPSVVRSTAPRSTRSLRAARRVGLDRWRSDSRPRCRGDLSYALGRARGTVRPSSDAKSLFGLDDARGQSTFAATSMGV